MKGTAARPSLLVIRFLELREKSYVRQWGTCYFVVINAGFLWDVTADEKL